MKQIQLGRMLCTQCDVFCALCDAFDDKTSLGSINILVLLICNKKGHAFPIVIKLIIK